jgi:DNA-binding response OmpR family regulator
VIRNDELAVAAGARRVLVIEDEPGIRGFAVRALRGAGFTVDEAAGGREGLRMACHRRPDVVLLDLRLPDLHGEEVLRCLRRDRPGQAVVVWSATADRAAEHRCLALGARTCLRKPVSLAELVGSLSGPARPAAHGRPAAVRHPLRPLSRPACGPRREPHPRHRAAGGVS